MREFRVMIIHDDPEETGPDYQNASSMEQVTQVAIQLLSECDAIGPYREWADGIWFTPYPKGNATGRKFHEIKFRGDDDLINKLYDTIGTIPEITTLSYR